MVERTDDAERTTIDDVGIGHGASDILVTRECLNGADVGSGFELVGGEAVAEGVARGAAVDLCGDGGVLRGLLHGDLWM